MSLIEPGCTVKFTTPEQLFHESKITVRFWIVTIVLAAITIITLKNQITVLLVASYKLQVLATGNR